MQCFYAYANVHWKTTNIRNVRNATLIRLKYQQYLDNIHVDKN